MDNKIDLTEVEKAKIEIEEKYRFEFRRHIEEKPEKKSLPKTIWETLNSSFGLWLLSAIFITGVGAVYTQYQNSNTERLKTKDLVERLDLEIGYRFSQVQIQLFSLVDTKDKNYPFLEGKGENDVRKILDNLSQPPKDRIIPLYQEFSNLSTVALIAELRRYVPENERNEIDGVLAHLSGIYIFLDAEKANLSDTYGVAKLIFRDLMLQRWKDSRFYFTDCPFC